MLACKLTQLALSDLVSNTSRWLQILTPSMDLLVVCIPLMFVTCSAFKYRDFGLVHPVVIAFLPLWLVLRLVDDYLAGRRTILNALPFLVFTYVLAYVSVVPLWRFWKTITDPLQVTGETAPAAAAETNTQDDTSDSLCHSSSFVTGSRSACTQLVDICADTAAKIEDERAQQSPLARGHFPRSESEAYAAIIHDRMVELDILIAEQDRAFAEAQALRAQNELTIKDMSDGDAQIESTLGERSSNVVTSVSEYREEVSIFDEEDTTYVNIGESHSEEECLTENIATLQDEQHTISLKDIDDKGDDNDTEIKTTSDASQAEATLQDTIPIAKQDSSHDLGDGNLTAISGASEGQSERVKSIIARLERLQRKQCVDEQVFQQLKRVREELKARSLPISRDQVLHAFFRDTWEVFSRHQRILEEILESRRRWRRSSATGLFRDDAATRSATSATFAYSQYKLASGGEESEELNEWHSVLVDAGLIVPPSPSEWWKDMDDGNREEVETTLKTSQAFVIEKGTTVASSHESEGPIPKSVTAEELNKLFMRLSATTKELTRLNDIEYDERLEKVYHAELARIKTETLVYQLIIELHETTTAGECLQVSPLRSVEAVALTLPISYDAADHVSVSVRTAASARYCRNCLDISVTH